MSVFDNLANSKFMLKLQEFGGRLQSNKVFSSLANGMMGTMGLIMTGAIFTIIASVLSMLGVITQTDAVYQLLTMPYNMTMGLLGIAVAFSIAYSYSKALGMGNAITSGIVSLFLFMMVAAPIQQLPAEGYSLSVMNTMYLGGSGMFTAIVVAYVTVLIIRFCESHHIVIKLPDVVPEFLSLSFSSLIPMVISVVLWTGLNTACQMLIGQTLPAAIMAVIAIPLGVLTSPLGVFVVFTIGMLLWTVGIHGQMVVLMAFQVPYYAQLTINAQLVAAGQPAEFTPVFLLIDAMAVCGGCGNILPLTIQFMRSKSQQLRTIGKAGFFPCLFGVNEPVVYGTPIIFNPVMAIPFVLNTLILYWALYFGYSIGFFAAPYITGTQLPIFVYSFLTSMSVTNLLIPVIAFVIAWIVYYPFVKIYDRDLCEREAKIAEEEAAEAAALQEA